MANPNAGIRYTLERIRGAVRQQSLTQSVAAKGKKIGDPREREFWDKLALFKFDLLRILHQLKGKQVALENERHLLWRIPRDQRYSARQSIADREQVNLDLVELAEITLRELAEFAQGAGGMKPGDWEEVGQQATELAGKIDSALVHSVVQQLQKGPAFIATPLPGFGVEHLAPLVALITAFIASKLNRRK